MKEVRVVGTEKTVRINNQIYAGWSVEVFNTEAEEWIMVTTCYGPASLDSAETIANKWRSIND